MQTKKTLMRLLAVIMTVAMMVTAIPFSSVAAADESTITDTVVVGKVDGEEVVWKVLEKKADGSLLLISKDVIMSGSTVKFYSKAAVPDYEGSALETLAKSAVTFTDAEVAALADVSMSYTAIVDDAVTTKTYATKYAVPTMADYEAYGLKPATNVGGSTTVDYWLADAYGSSASDKNVYYLKNGTPTKQASNRSAGLRMVISLAANSYIALPEIEGVTFDFDGSTATYAVIGSSVKVVLDDNYNQSDITVKFGGTEATGTDGVYTVGAGEMTVEGVTVNPANYDAYNAAVAEAEALEESNYSAETWAALEEALAVDVNGLTAVDQNKIDDATAAITAAIAALAAAPADFTRYNAAVKAAKDIQASTLHNLNYKPEGSMQNINALITLALKNEATILTYTFEKQDEVDAAAKVLEDYVAQVPYKSASIGSWTAAVEGAKLNASIYDPAYVAEVQAKVDALVAENNFAERTDLDIRNQAEIDAATATILAVYADKANHFIPTNFSELDAALERAATYAEENYYKDEDVKREEEVGGTAAWDAFVAKVAEAKRFADNKDLYTKAYESQEDINAATAQLIAAMDKLDAFVRLSKWDRFVKDVEWFFYDVKYEIDGIIALLKTVFGLLGMLFRGEIDLYGLFELLDVGEDVLNFLIKIGITPKDYVDPGDGTTPAPEA